MLSASSSLSGSCQSRPVRVLDSDTLRPAGPAALGAPRHPVPGAPRPLIGVVRPWVAPG